MKPLHNRTLTKFLFFLVFFSKFSFAECQYIDLAPAQKYENWSDVRKYCCEKDSSLSIPIPGYRLYGASSEECTFFSLKNPLDQKGKSPGLIFWFGKEFPVQNSKSPYPVGSPYQQERATLESGPFIEERSITEDERVFIHEQASYITWDQGKKKGSVYRILTRGKDTQFKPPSLSAFLKHLDSTLLLYSTLPDSSPFFYKNKITGEEILEKKGLNNQTEWEFFYAPTEKMKTEQELSVFIYKFFDTIKYGDFYPWNAQYFHFSGKNEEEIIRFYILIQNIGLDTFITDRVAELLVLPKIRTQLESFEKLRVGDPSLLIQLYKNFLECVDTTELKKGVDRIEECKPDEWSLELPLSDIQEFKTMLHQRVPLISQNGGPIMDDQVAKQVFVMPQELSSPILPQKLKLTHGTSNRKLPNIIQLSGLYSLNQITQFGIKKTFGGETGNSEALDPEKVSFWGRGGANGGPLLELGYGKREGFEYPISFAVSETKFQSTDCHEVGRQVYRRELGGYPNEVTSLKPWPLRCFDYLIVPWFAVEDIQNTLKEHALPWIRVIPYTHKLLEAYGAVK